MEKFVAYWMAFSVLMHLICRVCYGCMQTGVKIEIEDQKHAVEQYKIGGLRLIN